MNWGAKGSLFERQVKEFHESRGFYVIKSGGSLGVFDLIAIKKGQQAVGIQCKNRKALISVAEWNEILDVGNNSGVLPALAEKIQGTSTFLLSVIKQPREKHDKNRDGKCEMLGTFTIPKRGKCQKG